MQNAQNLMSSFEFIAALMSIIIGLGVTNLIAGAGRAFYRRNENPLDEVHIVLTPRRYCCWPCSGGSHLSGTLR